MRSITLPQQLLMYTLIVPFFFVSLCFVSQNMQPNSIVHANIQYKKNSSRCASLILLSFLTLCHFFFPSSMYLCYHYDITPNTEKKLCTVEGKRIAYFYKRILFHSPTRHERNYLNFSLDVVSALVFNVVCIILKYYWFRR